MRDDKLSTSADGRISETNINGCNTGSYSRMAKRCRECNNKEYCSNKRLEAEAYIIGVDMAAGKDFTHTQVAGGVTTQEAIEAIGEAMRKIYCSSRT